MNTTSICISILVLGILFSCKDAPQNTSEKINKKGLEETSGTLQMRDSIQKIKQATNFRKHIYESGERLKLIEEEVNSAKANGTLTPNLYVEYGQVLLEAGRSQDAIAVFETILTNLPANNTITTTTKVLHEALALGYLRLGEQLNCLENHSTESCLFPIKGKGIHINKSGSQMAIKKYKDILKVFPDDLQSRWLLNVAYMTLGDYPENVPSSLRIEPSAFKPEYELAVFENISIYL